MGVLTQYGELEDLIVLENLGDHLIGNLYVKYNKEEQSDAALKGTACLSFALHEAHLRVVCSACGPLLRWPCRCSRVLPGH